MLLLILLQLVWDRVQAPFNLTQFSVFTVPFFDGLVSSTICGSSRRQNQRFFEVLVV